MRPAHECMEHFQYAHLPVGPMRDTSQLFARLAKRMDDDLEPGREKDKVLDHLLYAKDAAVRQARLDMKAAKFEAAREAARA